MAVNGQIARLEVLGVHVSAVNTDIAISEIVRWIKQGHRSYATLTGVHGVMESVRSEEIRLAHNCAGLVLPDGMPLVWVLRQGGFKFADRVFGPDLMLALFERSEQTGYRHFFYGTTPRTLTLLKDNLKLKFPAAAIVGDYAPPFRPAGAREDEATIDAINKSAADIIWVGLGCPKQELWMAQHRHRLSATVLIGVGAAFDIHAQLVREPPRWLLKTGLLMIFRVAMEPRRLAKRLLRNHPAFLGLLAIEKLGIRRIGRNSKP
jgi:N-acetylglucosaminyldiphosphoundecaprenol N-acetyl-beta-D-mannosaminyltransferase